MSAKGVRIAELKTHLSEHLRRVRRGHSITILDRETPVARLVPVESRGSKLAIRWPRAGAPRLASIPLPPPLELDQDIVSLLLEERQGER